jgi:peptidyl-prolyl cis-trans isomerase SurA
MKRPFILLGALALACAGFTAEAALVNGLKAVVHDSVVTYDQVERLTSQTLDVQLREYRNNPQELERRINAARAENLEKLLDQELILQEFKRAGYSLPENVLDELVREKIRSQFQDRATLTKTLQARGMTYEKFRQQVRDQFIVEALRQKNISSEVLVSPHKIERYYEANKERFKVNDQAKLRMIILNRPAGETNNATRKLAEEILLKLKEGTPFAELASLYSQGPERNQGGERPLQEVKELRKELAEAVNHLNPGEVSDIIDTGDVIWIVRVDEKKPAHFKPLAEVRDQIERDLLVEERSRIERQWLERLRKKTFVRYF